MRGSIVLAAAAAVLAGVIATERSAQAQTHQLIAHSYTKFAGSESTNNPSIPRVEGKFVQSFAGGSVDNKASVDVRTLVLEFEIAADQVTGSEIDPREWNTGAQLVQGMTRPATGGATGIEIRMPFILDASSTTHGTVPTIINQTASLAIGTCKISVEQNTSSAGKSPINVLGGCEQATRRAYVDGHSLVVHVDELRDAETVTAGLAFQPSLGAFQSHITARSRAELHVNPIGGAVEWASPLFGKASGGASGDAGATTSGVTPPAPGAPTNPPDPGSSGATTDPAPIVPVANDAAPPASDDSCTVGLVGARVPVSLAGLVLASVAIGALGRRRRRAR